MLEEKDGIEKDQAEGVAKRPYQPPQLICFGGVRELTHDVVVGPSQLGPFQ